MAQIYAINKLINRPLEFKGLKGQYVPLLGLGLVSLLLLFVTLYLLGLPLWLLLLLVFSLGSLLFFVIYRLSRRFGRYGLLKWQAARRMPQAIRFPSRKLFFNIQHPQS